LAAWRSRCVGAPAGGGAQSADIFFRQLGGYLETDAPLILGHDGSGIIEAVGKTIRELVSTSNLHAQGRLETAVRQEIGQSLKVGERKE
jgi:hypothetical protein